MKIYFSMILFLSIYQCGWFGDSDEDKEDENFL